MTLTQPETTHGCCLSSQSKPRDMNMCDLHNKNTAIIGINKPKDRIPTPHQTQVPTPSNKFQYPWL